MPMMLADLDLHELLRPQSLRLPAQPRVIDVKWQPYEDSEGKDAILVWVILDNRTRPAQRRWKRLQPIEIAVRDALSQAKVPFWPYFKYRTRAEYLAERRRA